MAKELLNISMINTSSKRGGAAQMAKSLSKAINQYLPDFSCTLLHADDARNEGDVIGISKTGQKAIHAGLARLHGSFNTYDKGNSEKLLKISAEAEIVHLHNLHGYYLNIEHLISGLRGRKVLWTWHDAWPVTGRCAFPSTCLEWKRGCPKCPDLSRYPAAWLDNAAKEHQIKTRIFLKNEELKIAVPSGWMKDIAIERGYPSQRIHVIQNPVELGQSEHITERHAREKLNLPLDAFITLFVAADCREKRKGYHDFESAISGIDGIGLVVGNPPIPRNPKLRYLGTVKDRRKLRDIYSAATLFVIPTYADNYPNTVIESLSCGTPVIGYAEGGVPTQLRGMTHCETCPTGDIEQLKARIQNFSSKPALGEADSQTLAEVATKRWSLKTVAKKYSEIYRIL